MAAGEDLLNRSGIPTFPYPDTAARAFQYMWRYSYSLRGLYETPLPLDDSVEIDRVLASRIVDEARQSGRTLLTEAESKQILAAYGIPVVQTLIATTEDEAVTKAQKLGYPVVLKLFSETVTHKTDVGGVQLNIADEMGVRTAYRAIRNGVESKVGPGHFQGVTVQPMVRTDGYEIILGSSLDPQFGPVLLFGAGGQLVEVFRDRALALPPLNTTLARRMMEQTRIFKALQGVRGRRAVDMAALESLIVRFSQLVVEQRWIREIDINPLLASADQLIALDARVVLHPENVTLDSLPKLAVRPYPTRYIGESMLRDGEPVTIRPIRPEDEPLMVAFHGTLSEQSVYFRYFHMMNLQQRVAHERLTRICFIDYAREIALVAEEKDAAGDRRIVGVARLTRIHLTDDAEFAVLIADSHHHKGLGTQMVRRLIDVARAEKVKRIIADILPENRSMVELAKKVGFSAKHNLEEEVVKVELILD